MQVGQVTLSNNFTSDAVQPFLRILAGFDFATFCTTDEIVGTPALREGYATSDPEPGRGNEDAAAVADVVVSREIPFLAIRVISDDYQQVLPVGALSAGFDPAKGRATPLRLLAYLALHPREFKPFNTLSPASVSPEKTSPVSSSSSMMNCPRIGEAIRDFASSPKGATSKPTRGNALGKIPFWYKSQRASLRWRSD